MNFRKLLCAPALACLTLAPASAHDAWIELAPAGDAQWDAQFYIGHAEDRNIYALEPARVSAFSSLGRDGVESMLPSISDYSTAKPLSLTLNPEGSHVVMLNTFRAFSELESKKFNEYAAEEGIAPILHWRVEKGEINSSGTEVYSRFLKALAPVAGDGCDMSQLSKPVGQVLEIIPLSHPGAGCSDTLEFELRYFGEPVEGATLHLNRTDETFEPIKMPTDANGRASFTRPDDGKWYVHAAWAMPVNEEDYGADFATSFASVSFNLSTDETSD